MTDIADELDGIIKNLPCLEDGLELGSLVLVHQVLVQVKAGGGQQGAGIIVQVGRQALAFFLLQTDRGVQQDLLLFLFHMLELRLVADHLALVENDKEDQTDSQYKHTQGTQKEY